MNLSREIVNVNSKYVAVSNGILKLHVCNGGGGGDLQISSVFGSR